MAAAGEQTMTELVTMHSGKASAVDGHSGRVVIKPSGMDYEKLSADLLVITDLAGRRTKPEREETGPIPVSTCRTISTSTIIARMFVALCIPNPTTPLALLC
jgi:ribulose-5-phosphate 4-epimerase/fuculose-1-phosphate aldolase